MTITSTTNVAIATGNGAATNFPFTFRLDDEDELIVSLLTIADNTEETLTLTTDYTITGVGDDAGGSVTYTGGGTPLPATKKIIIKRVVPLDQETVLNNQGGFFPEVIETQLDRLVMQIQQVAEKSDRAIIVPSGVDLADYDTFYTNLYNVAGSMSAITSVNANSANINTVAGMETDISDLLGQVNTIQSAVDDFGDRYLTPKASDPSVDDDGDALTAGIMFFNTTLNSMRIYDGTDWGDVSTTVARNLFEYTATAGQTVFTGADREGNILSTGNRFLNVHLNGARLTPTDDYTYDASSVTFTSPVNSGDEVLIEALNTFEIIDGILSTAQVLTDGQKTQARTNIEAASEADITRVENALGGYRNKIINGDFDIWQRGTSQTSSGYGSADRWSNIHTGSTKTVSRQSFTVGQTDVPGNPKYFMRHVVTSVAGAGNYAIAIHKIENARQFAGKTVTVTFYAKADSAKNICNEFYRFHGSGGSPTSPVSGIGSTTQNLTTSWQKFSYTVDIPSDSGVTYGTNDDHHLELLFWFDAGTNHDARTNSLGQQSGTFDIARVSLVEGDATGEDDPFEARHIQQELMLCQRYYEACANSSVHWATLAATANAAYIFNPVFSFSVEKRITPTVTINDLTGGVSFQVIGVSTLHFDMRNESTDGGGGADKYLTWAADAEL